MIKELKFVTRIEDFPQQEIEKRIKYGMEFKIPHKLNLIPYLGKIDQVNEYVFEELMAYCPVTKVSDLYTIIIRYIPDKYLPELKSLKLYFWDYRICNVPISHEHLAAKIYKEFNEIIKPKQLYIKLKTAGRGEIFTTIRVGDLELDKLEERSISNM